MLKKAVYVWEAPIRIYHWVNVVLIIILLVTGFFIGKPIFTTSLVSSGDAYANFLMGQMRIWHGIAAWLFIANFIFRFYWALVGNEHARFKPWRKGFVTDGIETLKYYLFLKKEHTLHTGHNVIAQLAYILVMWIGSLFMILTGLALQGEIAMGGLQERWFGWLLPLFGQSYTLRLAHHLVAWIFVAFIVVHLYLVIRQELLDDDGTVSSIISGYKFVITDARESHEKE
ncbi:MAG: Ni/Fe-hydrogenase, b-type cytochrome subunit [Syntrophomonadaceae bacterium]